MKYTTSVLVYALKHLGKNSRRLVPKVACPGRVSKPGRRYYATHEDPHRALDYDGRVTPPTILRTSYETRQFVLLVPDMQVSKPQQRQPELEPAPFF